MKRIISLTIMFILALPLFASAASVLSDCALQSPGSSASDWSAIALFVSDEAFDSALYISGLKQYVADKYLTESKLSPTKATEWHRIALAISLAGENATDFDGINLINDGIFYRENLGRQGINAYIWALTTMSSGNYSEPQDALNNTDSIISMLLSKQNADGSFSLKADAPDCDITAMAIYALSAYRDREEVLIAINNALSCLASLQNPDGSFSANGIPNAETTSQVIIALSALGHDVKTDSRFPQLYSALSAFRTEDGYSHTYGGETDVIATYQAVCAIAAAERKTAIYNHISELPEEPFIEETPTKTHEEVSVNVSATVTTEAIEEQPTTESITMYYNEEQTEGATEILSVENEQNSSYFFIFIAVLIVIILIYGIIKRRIR